MELTFKRGGQRKDEQINKKTSQGDKTYNEKKPTVTGHSGRWKVVNMLE